MPESTRILAVDNGIETAINNTEELKKYIQFLLRTDSRQEWTTDKTPDDWVTFPIFDEEAFAFGDEDSRRGLSEILSDAVTVILAGENTPLEDNMVKNYLYSFTLMKADEKGNIINNPFTLDERDFIIGKFIEYPYADLIALVCHRDYKDGCERMHGVFVWTPGKINRIMAILQNDEEESDYDGYEDNDEPVENNKESREESDEGSIDDKSDDKSDNDVSSENTRRPKTNSDSKDVPPSPFKRHED